MVILTSELVRAARALLRWEQRDLEHASSVSLPTIKRLESTRGVIRAHRSTRTAAAQASACARKGAKRARCRFPIRTWSGAVGTAAGPLVATRLAAPRQ